MNKRRSKKTAQELHLRFEQKVLFGVANDGPPQEVIRVS